MTNWFRRFDDWLERATTSKSPPVPANPVDKYLEQDERERQAIAEQVRLAEAAKDEYRERYAKGDAEATAAFRFACSRDGAFLRIEAHGHVWVVNTAFLQRVDLRPGSPPDDTGLALAMAETWFTVSRHSTPPYLLRYEYVPGYPAPAHDAEITFLGVDLSISTPHSLGQAVYDQIVDAIAKGTDQ